MTKAEITELLSRVPLFSGCSLRETAAIGRAAKEVHRRQGSVLARTGEAGVGVDPDTLHVVVELSSGKRSDDW